MTLLQRLGPAVLAAGLVSVSAAGGHDGPPGGPSSQAVPGATKPVRLLRELAASFEGDKAVTRPSRDSVMGFSFPTQIEEVAVRGGQAVKAGDLLVRAKDASVVAEVELYKLQSENKPAIDHAQAGIDQAQIEFDSQVNAKKSNAATQIEYDRAKNTLDTKKIELDQAQYTLDLYKAQWKVKVEELDKYRLKAPFDGRVDQVMVDVGQAMKESESAIRVVKLDPLWIEVPAPVDLTLSAALKEGDAAWVLMDLPGEPKVYPGRVIELVSVADSASATRRVRVELRNPQEWPAGLATYVRFTPPAAGSEWAGRVVQDWPVGGVSGAVSSAAGAAREASHQEGGR
jgi:RND family efflux transporter MFP subunit